MAGGAAAVAIVLASASAAAEGEPSAAELASARSLFNEARAAEERGEWVEALSKLEAVAKVKMTPQVRFHLGLCQEHTTQLVEALNNLERAASEGSEQHLANVATEANEHAASVRERLPKLSIVLPAGVDLRVEVDGRPIASVLLTRPMQFDPGAHKIVATAPGLSFSRDVSVGEGEEKRIEVVLTPVAGVEAPPDAVTATPPATLPPAAQAPASDNAGEAAVAPSGAPTLGWVALGVGGAALAGAGITAIVRQGALNDIEDLCPTHQNCPRSLESDQSRARTFGALSVVFAVVGVASATTGAVLLLQPRSSTAPKVAVRPWWGPAGVGAAGTLSW